MCILRSIALALILATSSAHAELDGKEIVGHCLYKNAGDSQRSKLSVTFTDKSGRKNTRQYLRLWKNYHGKDGIVDKVVMYTLYPPSDSEVNFLRWGYTSADKPADQWVYIPELKSVRRITKRSQENMDWGLNDEDLSFRELSEDDHVFKGITSLENLDYYVVESIPKTLSAYGKRIFYFRATTAWEECVPKVIEYYDRELNIMKRQFLEWQNIDGGWVWKSSTIDNLQTFESVLYKMEDVEINIKLEDRQFSTRELARGLRLR